MADSGLAVRLYQYADSGSVAHARKGSEHASYSGETDGVAVSQEWER